MDEIFLRNEPAPPPARKSRRSRAASAPPASPPITIAPEKIIEAMAPRLPHEAMVLIMRAEAHEAGIPARCPQRGCRRTGGCQAKDFNDGGPPCAGKWSDADFARLEQIFIGMVLAHTLEAERIVRELRRVAAEEAALRDW